MKTFNPYLMQLQDQVWAADQLGLLRGSGVQLWRVGDLSRRAGFGQWKPGPAGTGRRAEQLLFSMASRGMGIYSGRGLRAVGCNGTLMSEAVARQLFASDVIACLDAEYPIAAALQDSGTEVPRLETDPAVLAAFGGNETRAANYADAVRVFRRALALQSDRPSS